MPRSRCDIGRTASSWRGSAASARPRCVGGLPRRPASPTSRSTRCTTAPTGRRATFDADVDAFTQAPAWVTEWQYSSARELLASRADTLVWLDLPIRTALTRVTRRTIQRSRTREELWNGNIEPGLWHALTDDEGIIRWAYQHRHSFRTRVPAAAQTYPHLQVVRLRNQREVDRWVTRAL